LSVDERSITQRLSLFGAVLVTVSFALPFYTCTRYVDAAGEAVEVEEGAPVPEGVTAVVELHRPMDGLDLSDLDEYPLLLTFLWPIALVGARRVWPRMRELRAVAALESLLIVWTGWVFHAFSTVGDRAWGAYVAFAGLVLYAGAFILELWHRFRHQREV